MARSSRPSLSKRQTKRVIVTPPVMSEAGIREKCRDVLREALKDPACEADVGALSRAIEEAIYTHTGANVGPSYRASVRSHLFNLKDKRNNLRDRLLRGELSPDAFGQMSTKEMATVDRIQEDERLRSESLHRTILTDTFPTNILEIKAKDGRERGKWGVTSSAAAIDYFS